MRFLLNPINRFSTKTLTTSNIENKAAYDAKATSATVGYGIQGGLPQLSGAGIGQDDGKVGSTTVSAVSAGEVNVTDNTSQQNLTGKDSKLTVATLNRDVHVNEKGEAVDSQGNSTANTISPIFDAEKVQREIDAQVKITQAFGQQAGQAIELYTEKQMNELRARYAVETDPEKQKALQSEVDQLRLETHVGEELAKLDIPVPTDACLTL